MYVCVWGTLTLNKPTAQMSKPDPEPEPKPDLSCSQQTNCPYVFGRDAERIRESQSLRTTKMIGTCVCLSLCAYVHACLCLHLSLSVCVCVCVCVCV